jgi:hypothetical protein
MSESSFGAFSKDGLGLSQMLDSGLVAGDDDTVGLTIYKEKFESHNRPE